MPRTLPLLILLLVAGLALAQPTVPPDPGAVADEAVAAWLESEPIRVASAITTPTELCLALPGLLTSPPPPQGTRVNLEDRHRLEIDEPDAASFTYSAVRPNDTICRSKKFCLFLEWQST